MVLAIVLVATSALADRVDDLTRQLGGDPDYKVRLSAALNLGKLGDKRAVFGLTTALRDADKTVRGVAAAALGRLVDSTVPTDVVGRTIAELAQVAKSDVDGFVRGQAERALTTLRALGPGGATGKGVYVEVGPMADSTKVSSPEIRPVMRSTVAGALAKKPSFVTEWPGGKAPSRAELTRSGTAAAFYIDGTLTNLEVARKGRMAEITCNVSLLVATYPEKSMFAFPSGGGVVQTDDSEKSVAEGKRDCVVAVLEDVVRKQVVPLILLRVQ